MSKMSNLSVTNPQGFYISYSTKNSAKQAFEKLKNKRGVIGFKVIPNKYENAITTKGNLVKKGKGYNLILIMEF